PRKAASAHESALGLLRVRRALDHVVRQRSGRGRCPRAEPARRLRAALLDDDCLQPRGACRAACADAATDHLRLRCRVVQRPGGDVAGAIPDHRAVARPQVPPISVGHISATAGRDHHHRGNLRGDDAALHAVRQARTGDFALGMACWGGAFRPGPATDGGSRHTAETGHALMTPIYALFDDGQAAQRAVDRVRAAGVPEGGILGLSSRPLERFIRSRPDRAARQWLIAAVGGVIGLAFGTALTTLTQTAWPLSTGNMPIITWWANLIIMFEMTMLGAIVATVGTLLVLAGLGRSRGVSAPAVPAGQILVGVERPTAEQVGHLQRALRGSGSGPIKRLD